ncbi:MAG: hypothetical protein JJ913_14575 [Rhizobiaceae bacterium]|nr:hypothetical protein [Rhizobiaceae bacterium]
MTIRITPYLRRVLALDAATSGIAGVAMIAGNGLIAGLTDLPQQLLFWAGVVLVPWTAALAFFASREAMPRLALVDVAAINALWVAASVALLATGWIAPNMLGVMFVLAQAAAVALFTVLQVGALRAEAQAA